MENEKRLIDYEQAKRATYEEIFWTESEQAVVRNFLAKLPKVDAYTEEQVASIIHRVDELEARNRELEKECAWLRSCLNCKIRKECPRHCGKVVHDCDHWEYGDSAMDAVEVVRCKDCTNKRKAIPAENGQVIFCSIWGRGWCRVDPNDFCSYGEKRGV